MPRRFNFFYFPIRIIFTCDVNKTTDVEVLISAVLLLVLIQDQEQITRRSETNKCDLI